MTVTPPEALTPTTNAKWRLDVNTSEPATPAWEQLRAMQSFTPSVNPTTQDATDYDSEGWGADAVTLRKWVNAIVLGRKLGAAGYPASQEFLRGAADAGETVEVRWYERGIPTGEAYSGTALVQWEPQGGEASGLAVVNVTLLGQGERLEIAHPEAPPPPPA